MPGGEFVKGDAFDGARMGGSTGVSPAQGRRGLPQRGIPRNEVTLNRLRPGEIGPESLLNETLNELRDVKLRSGSCPSSMFNSRYNIWRFVSFANSGTIGPDKRLPARFSCVNPEMDKIDDVI
jgi:hypothetical protein